MDSLRIIEDQLEALLAREVDNAALRAGDAGATPMALSEHLDRLGLSLALLPEDDGGAGLNWSEAGRLFVLLGRRICPIPVAEEMIARKLLREAGLAAPAGRLSFHPGGSLRLRDGRVAGVLPGAIVDASPDRLVVTVAVSDEGQSHLVVLAAAAADRRPLTSIAREPRADLVLEATAPVASAPAPAMTSERLLAIGAMMRSSQIAGALHAILDLSVDYANTRQQFGRPIGKFQAVQQSLAVLATETAAADVAAASAWRAFDTGRLLAAAVAKVRTAAAARVGAAIAHQVHGAIGVTDEHILHHVTRRLWTWRTEFGNEQFWSEHLGRAFFDRPNTELWSILTEELCQ